MRNLLQDFRLAGRTLARSKGFTTTAVFTLALGLAANTIVFSIVNAALLRSLPYPNAEQITVLHWRDNHAHIRVDVTAQAFFMVRQQATSFESITVMHPLDVGINLGGIGVPQYRKALRVSEGFLATLNAAPYLGRDFRPDEDRAGGPRTVILSYGVWQRDFGGSQTVLGRSVRINNESYTVIAVMPREFRSYPDADLWVPLQLDEGTADPGSDYRVWARLKQGISLQRAQQELAILSQQSALPYIAAHPELKGELVAEELREFLVGHVRKSLTVLSGAVAFVLMIACTNLAILLLVRGLGRRQEIAMRAALGSSRRRLVQIPLTESIILAILGGLLGLILAKEVLPFILTFLPPELPLSGKVQIDGPVLVFMVVTSMLTVVTFGLFPAQRIARVDVNEILRQAPRGISPGARRTRTGPILVSTQMALTLVLLAGTGTLLRSFLELRGVVPGFDPQHVVVGQVSLAGSKYGQAHPSAQLLAQLLTRLQRLPDVEASASINGLPLERGLNLPVYPTEAPEEIDHAAGYAIISPDYFRVMRIPRLAGRYFSDNDRRSSPLVAIVNETLARRWWPKESAVGHFVKAGEELGPQFADTPRQIIGVVADIHESGLDRAPSSTMYVPENQVPDNIAQFVNKSFLTSILVRTRKGTDVATEIRVALASEDSDLALASVRPLGQVLTGSLANPRFYMSLTAVFGGIALLLTAIGLSGLLSYQVRMRTKEIGVRMAVGAKPSEIVLLFLKQGLKLVSTGMIAGAIVAYPLVQFLEKISYTSHRAVSGVVIKAAIPLVLIAAAASVLTSFKAASVDPTIALRTD